jgi:hypothetical protein
MKPETLEHGIQPVAHIFSVWNQRFNNANQNQFCLNCDWLQMHVVGPSLEDFQNPMWEVKRTGQSKVFKNIYSIRYKKHSRAVATYATDALEQIMSPGHGVLKIENFYLYQYASKLKDFVRWLLGRLHLKFIGITRLDLAYDFNSFCNRRDPKNFIKAFLNGKIVKEKQSKFRVAGMHGDLNHFNWITFGSKTSQVNYKLYNKSQEMRDETEKAHIVQDWKQNSVLDLAKDVWRLEFSVNSNTNELVGGRTSFKFHDLETLRLDVLAGLFHGLFEHYFTFRNYDSTQKRKDRMKPVLLLQFPDCFGHVDLKKLNPLKKDTTRSTKIFINKLNGHQDEMRGKDDDFVIDARAMISKLISVYSLHSWAEKKGIEHDSLNYVDDLAEATL